MKTKTLTAVALLSFFINAAFAGNGSVGTEYASDFFRRGALLSEDAIQADASYSLEVGGLDASLSAMTNQPTANGSADTYIIDAFLSKSLSDVVNLSLGLQHAEMVTGEATMDIAIAFDIDTLLSPSVSLYRNVDETLYTLEVGVSHDFDIKVATLSLLANYGHSEISSALNVDYHSLAGVLSKDISENAALHLSVASVNSDSIERKTLIGLGINVKF